MKQLLEHVQPEQPSVQPEVRDSHSMFLSKTSRNDVELGRLVHKITENAQEEVKIRKRASKVMRKRK